jgi:hypothetical protein
MEIPLWSEGVNCGEGVIGWRGISRWISERGLQYLRLRGRDIVFGWNVNYS